MGLEEIKSSEKKDGSHKNDQSFFFLRKILLLTRIADGEIEKIQIILTSSIIARSDTPFSRFFRKITSYHTRDALNLFD